MFEKHSNMENSIKYVKKAIGIKSFNFTIPKPTNATNVGILNMNNIHVIMKNIYTNFIIITINNEVILNCLLFTL